MGIEGRIVIGLITSTFIYYHARNWLRNLRDGL